MKTKIVALVAVAFLVCGVAVYVYASSDASSTELSISSIPESTSLASGNDGCAKKAECDKPAEKKECPKSEEDCPKSKEGCDKSEADSPKSKEGCPMIKKGCPLSE